MGHDLRIEIDTHDDEERELRLLRALRDRAGGSTDAVHSVRDLGRELRIPFEQALTLTGDLDEDGFVRRVGRYRAPEGPGVQLTSAGLRAAAL